LRLTAVLTLPAAVALAVLSAPLIATLFHHGQFGAEDVWMTRRALVAYSVGLTGLILVKVLAPGFYARQDIRTPVRAAVVTLFATQAMNLAFIFPLKHAGLALAISLGACLNSALLYRQLRRQGIYRPGAGWGWFLAKIAAALSAMAVVLWFGAGPDTAWLTMSAMQRTARLAAVIAAGAATYFATLWLFGFRLAHFSRRAAH
jgi:putative peptidoglycan lipid II flippase